MGDKVVYLNREPAEGSKEYSGRLACECRNKTFVVDYMDEVSFPVIKCASCGQHIGKIGWANKDEDNNNEK